MDAEHAHAQTDNEPSGPTGPPLPGHGPLMKGPGGSHCRCGHSKRTRTPASRNAAAASLSCWSIWAFVGIKPCSLANSIAFV